MRNASNRIFSKRIITVMALAGIAMQPVFSKTKGAKMENKEKAVALLNSIQTGDAVPATEYVNPAKYIQHNPHIADKLSGLGAALEAMAKQGIAMKYGKIHKVLGEGNFVLVASEGAFAGKPTSFYDLFRVEKGKIAEHWNTMETIPDAKEWKNTNGKF